MIGLADAPHSRVKTGEDCEDAVDGEHSDAA